MKTNKGKPLPIDIQKDIYTLYNIDGVLKLFYKPIVAKIYYRNRSYDFINKVYEDKGTSAFMKLLERESLSHCTEVTKIIIPFYELGHIFENIKDLELDTPIGIWLEYSSSVDIEDKEDKASFDMNVKKTDYDDYKRSYDKGREHLLRGDCYQYNLTFAQEIEITNFNLEQFLSLWQNPKLRGAYANITSIDGEVYYSNSPECLFDLNILGKVIELNTMPIKGTMAVEAGGRDEAWRRLEKSKKDESELFMITDLLRNDLNRIEKPIVEVLTLKKRLEVPGLIHSYSHLRVRLSARVDLLRLLKAIFPGGSITGAPKRRVMEIIENIEQSHRGFYCGSTILKNKKSFRASINIRSGKLDKSTGKLIYFSGGGVTLGSECRSEYEELMDKMYSFVQLLR